LAFAIANSFDRTYPFAPDRCNNFATSMQGFCKICNEIATQILFS